MGRTQAAACKFSSDFSVQPGLTTQKEARWTEELPTASCARPACFPSLRILQGPHLNPFLEAAPLCGLQGCNSLSWLPDLMALTPSVTHGPGTGDSEPSSRPGPRVFPGSLVFQVWLWDLPLFPLSWARRLEHYEAFDRHGPNREGVCFVPSGGKRTRAWGEGGGLLMEAAVWQTAKGGQKA